MLKCQICHLDDQTSLLTRCCKLFICDPCKQKYQKLGSCSCGKYITHKKLCTSNPQLFQIIKNYYQKKPQECHRCDKSVLYQCIDCNMLFCQQCNIQIHNSKGFTKHIRNPYTSQPKSQSSLFQSLQKKPHLCPDHKLPIQHICQCTTMLCSTCLKLHKDTCTKTMKIKSIKQYKQQFFSQVLFKIKQITQFKSKLLIDKNDYINHFNQQQQLFTSYYKVIQQQLQGIKKLLQMKCLQIKTRLTQYWKSCTSIYKKTQYLITESLKKYDDLAHLSQKFIQKLIGYDYLQKKVKKFYLNYQYFYFKLQGFQDTQFAIINLSTFYKNWQLLYQDKSLLNNQQYDQKSNKQKKIDNNFSYLTNTTSEVLLQCSQHPLNHRPLTLKSSHNQIYFEFLHLPYHHDTYQIQYGVGLKMKGQQVFKKLQNKNGIGLITSLNPSTKYRVRMRVGTGTWGPITQIKTQQSPKFNTELCISSKYKVQPPLQLVRQGIIYGSNQIQFGIHSWQIKIFPTKHNGQQTACITIGVSNKQQKKHLLIGTTLNYGYQKSMIAVKILLNCQQNKMTISSTGNQDQIYQNLPNLPIYPAIQNKGSNPVQIQCVFF